MTYTPLLRFTHLAPDEQEIARLFIEKNPVHATDWIFDEHLGEGMTPNPDWPIWLMAMSKSLTQRRVDLIGTSNDGTWLIELKQRGDIHAIGQLLVYESLYKVKHPHTTRLHLALVCRYLGFDLELPLLKYDIAFYIV